MVTASNTRPLASLNIRRGAVETAVRNNPMARSNNMFAEGLRQDLYNTLHEDRFKSRQQRTAQVFPTAEPTVAPATQPIPPQPAPNYKRQRKAARHRLEDLRTF